MRPNDVPSAASDAAQRTTPGERAPAPPPPPAAPPPPRPPGADADAPTIGTSLDGAGGSAGQAVSEVRPPARGEAVRGGAPWCDVPWGFPRVEGYEIIGALGAGGMGVVWRAVQLSTRRVVALKLMGQAQIGSERARRRFDREIELTGRLEHPNIARLYDSGLASGSYYYAMELIEGRPLDEHVRERGLSRRQVLALMADVCAGVQHAHQRGVIHRDLKPSNILVDAEGRPRVLDFGLARSFEPGDTSPPVSLDGEAAGTPAFMSPEQARGDAAHLDTRTDVYSLGVILHLLLSGQYPHDPSGLPAQVMARVAQGEIRDPRRCIPDLDSELRDVLLKALATDPDERYTNAGELGRDLRSYLAGEPVVARPATLFYFLRKRLWRHRLPVAIVTLAVAALLALWVISSVRVRNALAEAVAGRAEADRRRIEAEEARRAEAEARRAENLQRAQLLVSVAQRLAVDGDWDGAEAASLEAIEIHRLYGQTPLAPQLVLMARVESAPYPVAEVATGDASVLAWLPGGGGGGRGGASAAEDTGAPAASAPATSAPATSATSSGDPGVFMALSRGRVLRVGRDGAGSDLGAAPWVVHQAVVCPGSARVVLATADGTAPTPAARATRLRILDGATGRLVAQLNTGLYAPRVAASHDASVVACAGHRLDGRAALRLWRLAPSPARSPDDDEASDDRDDRDARGGDGAGPPEYSLVGEVRAQYVDVALSPDGRALVASTMTGELHAWEAATFPDSQRRVTLGQVARRVAAPGPGRALVASDDGALKLVALSDPLAATVLTGRGAPVRCLTLSADGRRALAGDDEGTVRMWALDAAGTGGPLATYVGHRGAIRIVSFGPDGRHVISSGHDGAIRVWPTRAQPAGWTARAEGSGGFAEVALEGALGLILVGRRDGRVFLHDAAGAAPVAELPGPRGPVGALAFEAPGESAAGAAAGSAGGSAGGSALAAGRWGGVMRYRFGTARGQASVSTLTADGNVLALDAAIAPARPAALICGREGARIVDAGIVSGGGVSGGGGGDGAEVRVRDLGVEATVIRVVAARRSFLLVHSDGRTHLVDADGTVQEGPTIEASASRVALDPQHRWVAVAEQERGALHIVPMRGDGEAVAVNLGGAPPTAIAWVPGTTELLVGDAAGAVHVHEAEKGRRLATLGRLDGQVDLIALSPDGRCIAVISDSGRQLTTWDLARAAAASEARRAAGPPASLRAPPTSRPTTRAAAAPRSEGKP